MEFKNNYETVFILNPALSEDQMKDTADKFVQILKDNGADVINVEHWGLRKLAYPIQNKTTGFYNLVEFNVEGSVVATLETEFRRDDRILRFLTVALDKHAVDYNERRRKGEFKGKREPKQEPAS